VLIEDGDGDPYAYGKLDRNAGSPTLFCCDGTDMGTTEAVEVEIYMDNGGDIVCLQDASVGNCLNEITPGLQYWDAGATIVGGIGDDEFRTAPTGTHVDDIDGGNGGDTIFTYGGADVVDGGGGADTINAGDDGDTVYGGDQADVIGGGSGADTLEGEGGDDNIRGDAGIDTIRGGDAGDNLFGGTEADEIVGDVGADFVGGDAGDDCLCGGEYGSGNNNDGLDDTINGNAGTDTCYHAVDGTEDDIEINCGSTPASNDCWCAAP